MRKRSGRQEGSGGEGKEESGGERRRIQKERSRPTRENWERKARKEGDTQRV